MKKILFLGMICLMSLVMQAQRCAGFDFQTRTDISEEPKEGYTDLGLPSGTLWKNFNAGGLYSYDEAVSQFGDRLPSKAQWQELKNECQWLWTGRGYEVIGPNGKSIVLPAAGFGSSGGSVMQLGNQGGYWTTTSSGPDTQWVLGISASDVTFYSYYPNWRFSVRLVYK